MGVSTNQTSEARHFRRLISTSRASRGDKRLWLPNVRRFVLRRDNLLAVYSVSDSLYVSNSRMN